MVNKTLHKIDIQLSKVILLKDAFSGEAVVSGMQIHTAQGNKPVVKPGGYCLFLNENDDKFEVEITSPIYQTRKIWLTKDGGEEVEEIFLYPTKAYPVKTGSTVVIGTARPGTVINFHLEEGERSCRLLSDYQQGEDKIAVYIRDKAGNGNNLWFVRKKEEKTGEYFCIQEYAEGSQLSKLQQPLKTDYRKREIVIYRAYQSIADEEGEFCLLLGFLDERDYRLHYSYFKDGKEICKEVDIRGMKWNTMEEV